MLKTLLVLRLALSFKVRDKKAKISGPSQINTPDTVAQIPMVLVSDTNSSKPPGLMTTAKTQAVIAIGIKISSFTHNILVLTLCIVASQFLYFMTLVSQPILEFCSYILDMLSHML